MDNRIGVVLGLSVGFFVGHHWPKIYKGLRSSSTTVSGGVVSAAEAALRLAAETKERFDDARAEAKQSEARIEKAASTVEA
ncbi:hypothetical protein JYT28_00660 [Desulfobulbus sp. AH-315-M07]|nr:hypothetical protein [Desulfobulbus sp. AH-315-M07]